MLRISWEKRWLVRVKTKSGKCWAYAQNTLWSLKPRLSIAKMSLIIPNRRFCGLPCFGNLPNLTTLDADNHYRWTASGVQGYQLCYQSHYCWIQPWSMVGGYYGSVWHLMQWCSLMLRLLASLMLTVRAWLDSCHSGSLWIADHIDWGVHCCCCCCYHFLILLLRWFENDSEQRMSLL